MDNFGLQQLFANQNYLGPAVQAAEKEALDRQIKEQALARSRGMDPLDIQYRQGQVAAQAPALELSELQTRKARETSASDIASTNAINRGRVSDEELKSVSRFGQLVGSFGAILQDTPEPARAAQAVQWMQQHGIHPESTTGKYLLTTPPDQMKALSTRISQMRDDYIKSMGEREASTQGRIKEIQETGRQTRMTNKELAEQGRFKRADKYSLSIEQRLSMAKTPTEKAEILESAYYAADAAGDTDLAEGFKRRAIEARERVAEDARNRGLATKEGGIDTPKVSGLPARAGVGATAPIAGSGSAKPATTHKLSDVQKMYPGVPADKIREAYKRKFGVDLE